MTIMSRSAAPFWWGRELPREVAYLTKNHPHDEWVPTTYAEIKAKKVARQQSELIHKRRCAKVVYGYVWVFHVDWFLFSGYWLYIKTHKVDYGITFRHETNNYLVAKVMRLWSCDTDTNIDNFEEWAAKFAETYPHVGFKRKEKQGLVMCKCAIDEYGKLTNVIQL